MSHQPPPLAADAKRRQLREIIFATRSLKVVLGAGEVDQAAWICTDQDILNITESTDWQALFRHRLIDVLMAEHVWEHLTPDQARQANQNCFAYLQPGGRLRLAVPDGLHPAESYREAVRPGGSGLGAADHKALYDYKSLSALLDQAGFIVHLLEYWDENGQFHAIDWSSEQGHIRRSRRYDPRNQDGSLTYTSLIVDAIKPGTPANASDATIAKGSEPASSLSVPPIVLLVFNRPELTRLMLGAVRLAKPAKLLVVADGPRPDVPADAAACAEVRSLIEKGVDWPVELKWNVAESNLGLRRRVASGLTWAFEQVEEAIVLEDDCVPTPEFFRFCAELLQHYRHDTRIAAVTGDNFQPQPFACEGSYYFSKYTHCWGWASWRRAWQHFDEGMTRWPALRAAGWLETLFHDPRDVEYWTNLFDLVHRREMNSWALAWMFSCWSQSMLSILPKVNLVQNIGFGQHSSHTQTDRAGALIPPVLKVDFPLQHPSCVTLDFASEHYTQRAVFGTARPLPPQ